MEPILLKATEGEATADKPDREVRILCEHEWLTVSWFRYGAGVRGAKPHVHREHSDGFYVLDGEVTVYLGPALEPVVATAGSLLLIPPGVVHGFDNDGTEEARFINVHAPDTGFARYLREHHEDFDQHPPPEDGGRPASDAILTPPGGGERFQRSDRAITILGELTDISACLLEVDPEWPGIGAHSHDDQVDTFFVLEGESGFVSGDEVVRAGPGTFYGAAPGARHGVVHGGGRAAFLNVHGPDAGFAAGVRGQ